MVTVHHHSRHRFTAAHSECWAMRSSRERFYRLQVFAFFLHSFPIYSVARIHAETETHFAGHDIHKRADLSVNWSQPFILCKRALWNESTTSKCSDCCLGSIDVTRQAQTTLKMHLTMFWAFAAAYSLRFFSDHLFRGQTHAVFGFYFILNVSFSCESLQE